MATEKRMGIGAANPILSQWFNIASELVAITGSAAMWLSKEEQDAVAVLAKRIQQGMDGNIPIDFQLDDFKRILKRLDIPHRVNELPREAGKAEEVDVTVGKQTVRFKSGLFSQLL